MSPEDIRTHAAQLDRDIESAKVAIPRAQIVDAQAHLAGKASDHADGARKELRRLIDLRDGSRALAVRVELDNVEAEINKREGPLAKLAERCRELRSKVEFAARAVASNPKTDRAKAEAFAAYEPENLAFLERSSELRDLEIRRDALVKELAAALGA